MIKKTLCSLFLITMACITSGQISDNKITKLKKQLVESSIDSSRLNILFQLAHGYRFSNIDSSLFYTDNAIELAKQLDLPSYQAQMLSLKGFTVLETGNLPESMKYQFESLGISQQINDTSAIALALNRIGNIYMELADYNKANEYYKKSKELFWKIKDTGMYHNEVSNIGNIYELMKQPDSALFYQQIAYNASLKTNDRDKYTRSEIMFRMGNAHKLVGNSEQALVYYKKGVLESKIDNDLRNLTMNNLLIAKLYYDLHMVDSCMKYAYNAMQTAKIISFRKGAFEASVLLSELFKERNEYDSAYKYLSIANVEKESLIGTKRFQELQRIILDEQEQQRNAEAKRIAAQNKQKQLILIAGLGLFLIIAAILFRNNKQKQRTNRSLENTLTRLRLTQSQLIQSEKMASLGELTAGIAHEIQNPLNFVNNFSEVNNELIKEVQDIRHKTKDQSVNAEEDEILNAIAQNLEKISHHGKRAADIVKGMLQHSRSSSGVKEPTNINTLADEYLRLAYHGLRAKDKSFNATMETDFDETVGNINVVPQDIGRVILNLITNAFYVVNEKAKKGIENYEPTVTVSTHRSLSSGEGWGEVIIKVKDNGNGIPAAIKEKIFQPFFTTKPTGQGTGLGLSLSYDIVKAHGGELKVETVEGEGSEFIIKLPLV